MRRIVADRKPRPQLRHLRSRSKGEDFLIGACALFCVSSPNFELTLNPTLSRFSESNLDTPLMAVFIRRSAWTACEKSISLLLEYILRVAL